MNRAVFLVGFSLLALGTGVFFYKQQVLKVPLVPSNPEGVWQTELEVTLRGQSRARIRAALPKSNEAQQVFDETAASDRLSLSIQTDRGQRVGVWSGRLNGTHKVVYSFRVHLNPQRFELPQAPYTLQVPKGIAKDFLGAGDSYPTRAAEIKEMLKTLELPPKDDPAGRFRSLFAFVSHRVVTEKAGPEDALLTLLHREGSSLGKSRLLATLLRAVGLPSRTVRGLSLRDGKSPLPRTWVEVWLGERWIAASPAEGFFAERPKGLLSLGSAETGFVSAEGVEAFAHQFHSLRERLRPMELAAVMVPPSPFFAKLSLYRLPLRSQQALRILLLLPLGGLVVSILRNLFGLATYGIFMPVLIALALKEVPLVTGLLLVLSVFFIGILSRAMLDRLRLLVVPRLSILLCLVVLCVTGIALFAESSGRRDLFAGAVLPMVILTMFIERFSLVLAQEGPRQAMGRALSSALCSVAVYPVFTSSEAEHLMFGFPELVIAIMGCLVFIGGYTGFRVTDLIRFRLLARLEPPPPAGGGAPAP